MKLLMREKALEEDIAASFDAGSTTSKSLLTEDELDEDDLLEKRIAEILKRTSASIGDYE